MADTIKTPDANWQNNFVSRATRIGFRIDIPKAQLEYISAVAEAAWDTHRFGVTLSQNSSTIGTANALVSKGFIQRRPAHRLKTPDAAEPRHHELTPVGKLLVEMLHQARIFTAATKAGGNKASK